jgi:outer membrane lipoprotein SlyB
MNKIRPGSTWLTKRATALNKFGVINNLAILITVGDNMKTKQTIIITLISATALLGGCASSPGPVSSSQYPSSSAPAYSSAYGVVDSIQAVQSSSGNSSGLGTVAGGVVGGLLGNQVGSGNGRTAATVAGAVGGAVVGNQIAQNNQSRTQTYQIGVRLDNGGFQTIQQDSVADLNVGSRVRIENGRVYRY